MGHEDLVEEVEYFVHYSGKLSRLTIHDDNQCVEFPWFKAGSGSSVEGSVEVPGNLI